ncbi:MAG: CRISPR-associated endonuclease Cas3'' [Planctomycetes bacterium]|nr:CRISPR-associated endonuclease Cas3'' [Planctomycetota bacterium]
MGGTGQYAHSRLGRPGEEWHRLEEHLSGVAELAARWAGESIGTEWGWLAGLWHDLGKYRPDFQAYLRGQVQSAEHSIIGALLAFNLHHEFGLPLALAIAGHHGGLPNLRADSGGGPTPLIERLRRAEGILAEALPHIPTRVVGRALPSLPSRLLSKSQATTRSAEFWIRLLFSALVDADFLDTERFFCPGTRELALCSSSPIPVLRQRLDGCLDDLMSKADPNPVNTVRAKVLGACRDAAEQPLGFFSLSAPTGAGKTFSAMAFALRHAERHELRRVIVVIPYTSIIEQNAARYRKVLGSENVIEHHSNLDPATETQKNRLASENWDAPIIVTTSVQFFESLFGNKPSQCRKLHNIVRSVIVLDEVQTLPTAFLLPVLDGLTELVCHYGCSVVLSTATQPALVQRPAMPYGLAGVREIVPAPADLAHCLSRVEVNWPAPSAAPVEWPQLAQTLTEHCRVLAIVHRRQDARDLARLLPADGLYHLSALMCPKHRSDVLGQVQQALSEGRACRLVSTQLVEAGVDVDFPVVYRALAGLDSIAQAAGRCNREGLLARGQVVVFPAPTQPPAGILRKALDTASSLLQEKGGQLDLDDPNVIDAYFRNLYFTVEHDSKGIQAERQQLNFATVARKFKLIEDWAMHPVVVPYGASRERIEELRSRGPTRKTLRALQPYLVNVYEKEFDLLCRAGAVEVIGESVSCLAEPFHHLYDGRFGLVIEGSPLADPGSLIVSD